MLGDHVEDEMGSFHAVSSKLLRRWWGWFLSVEWRGVHTLKSHIPVSSESMGLGSGCSSLQITLTHPGRQGREEHRREVAHQAK